MASATMTRQRRARRAATLRRATRSDQRAQNPMRCDGRVGAGPHRATLLAGQHATGRESYSSAGSKVSDATMVKPTATAAPMAMP